MNVDESLVAGQIHQFTRSGRLSNHLPDVRLTHESDSDGQIINDVIDDVMHFYAVPITSSRPLNTSSDSNEACGSRALFVPLAAATADG